MEQAGIIIFNGKEYSYTYWERPWNILSNSEIENICYTELHGPCCELRLENGPGPLTMPDGHIYYPSNYVFADSFEGCIKRIRCHIRLYEIATTCQTLQEARQKWYLDPDGP